MLPGLLAGPNFDAAVFLLIGDRLRQGDLPYRDLWDHKPPGIYVIDAALVVAGGWFIGAWPSVWIGSVLANVGIGVGVLRAALPGVRRRGAGVYAAIVAASTASIWPLALGGGLTETFASLLLAVSWALAASSSTVRGWMVVGACAAAAVGTSLYALPSAAALLLVPILRSSWRSALTAALAGLGFAAAGLLVAATVGILPWMIDALVDYNAAYRNASVDQPLPESLAISGPLLGWYAANLVVLLAPACLGVVRGWRRPEALAAVVAIAGTAAMIGVGGRLYGHYLLLLVPTTGILAAFGMETVLEWARSRSRRAIAVAALALTLAVSGGAVYAGILTSAPDAYSLRDRDRAAAAFVTTHTAPDDPVLVWGNAPMVYQLSGTRPAWRYTYLLPLLTPGYVSDRLVAQLVDDLERAQPCYIIDAGSPLRGQAGLPPLLVDRPLTPSERRVDLLAPVRAYVRDAYDEVDDVSGWPVYQRRGGC